MQDMTWINKRHFNLRHWDHRELVVNEHFIRVVASAEESWDCKRCRRSAADVKGLDIVVFIKAGQDSSRPKCSKRLKG